MQRCARSSRKNSSGAGHRRAQEVRVARARRCGVPHGPQVELHAKNYVGDKYVVCNSDEGERNVQGSRHTPPQPAAVIEALAIGAYAWAPTAATTTSTAKSGMSIFATRKPSMRHTRGFLGDDSLGSGFSFRLYNHHGFGAVHLRRERDGAARIVEGKKVSALQAAFPGRTAFTASRRRSTTPRRLPRFPGSSTMAARRFESRRPNNGGTKLFRSPAMSSGLAISK